MERIPFDSCVVIVKNFDFFSFKAVHFAFAKDCLAAAWAGVSENRVTALLKAPVSRESRTSRVLKEWRIIAASIVYRL